MVALCTDGLDQTGTGLFALVDRTRRRLTAAAQENGVAVAPPVMLTGAPRFQNENLKLVEAQLFSPGEGMTSPDHQGIAVFEAQDPYEEAGSRRPPSEALSWRRAGATGTSPSSAAAQSGITAAWTRR